MKPVSKRQLSKCLHDLIKKSNHNFISDYDWITEYCSKPSKMSAVRALVSLKAISCEYFDGNDTPTLIIVQDDAFLLLHNFYNDKTTFIKGYILGIISAVLSGVLVNLITDILR